MVAGSFAIAALMLMAAMSQGARPALAGFHCMRIHAVMGGFNTNDNVQFVELRMNAAGQTLVSGHKVRFLDSAGTQTAEFTFPSGVVNGLKGDSILIGTAEFNNDYSPGANADFEFTLANTTGTSNDNRLHPVQPDGKVIFDPLGTGCALSGPPIDSVTYGTGAVTANWDGSKAAALPSPSTDQGLQLLNLATTPTSNSTEYALMTASTTTEFIAGVAATLEADKRFPRNNARVLTAVFAPPAVGGTVDEPALPDASPAPAPEDEGGVPLVPIVALGAAAIAATLGVGALRLRRRRA
jgi:hypothetical protein